MTLQRLRYGKIYLVKARHFTDSSFLARFDKRPGPLCVSTRTPIHREESIKHGERKQE